MEDTQETRANGDGTTTPPARPRGTPQETVAATTSEPALAAIDARTPIAGAPGDARAVLARAEQAVQAGLNNRRSSMITYYVAPGHKRKVWDALVEHEKGKVRRAVVTEDVKRRQNPQKYPVSAERENELVRRLVKRFPHVTESTMRLEIANIRGESTPNPQTEAETLNTTTSENDVYRQLQLEKEEAEAKLKTLSDAIEAGQQRLEQLTDEHTKLNEAY